MHRSRPSRSRILFEVFCALVVVASCVGAWMQTGASALLLAAAASALYGMVHLFDLAGPRPAVTVEPQRIDFDADDQGDIPAYEDAGAPLAATGQQLETDKGIEEAEVVELATPRGSGGRQTKTPRKSRARSASATKEAKAAELQPPEEVEVTQLAPPDEAEVALPVPSEEAAYTHIEPLFEPEPFARQQRMVFGRKAR